MTIREIFLKAGESCRRVEQEILEQFLSRAAKSISKLGSRISEGMGHRVEVRRKPESGTLGQTMTTVEDK